MTLAPLLRWLRRALLAFLSSLLVIAVGWYLLFLWYGPELKTWHSVRLTNEFTAQAYTDGSVSTLAQYVALENSLFAEVQDKVYARVAKQDRLPFNRFSAGSRSDPGAWDTNWNRTYFLDPAGTPVGGVLLLHGLTDSPYSLRSIGHELAVHGFKVVGLRLPGHGTIPAGLLQFRFEDLAAATQLAVRDLRAQLGVDKPIFVVGYSNGAALAVNYCLDALEQSAEPMPAGLVLISPAIGISPLAAIGRIRTGLSELQGFGRAAWQTIESEVDPFKYQSFSFHAAGATQFLTSRVARRIARLARNGPVEGLPPMLAFVSTVDSTVQAPAVVDSLLGSLAPGGHELVLFDVNRLAVVQPLLVADPAPFTRSMLAQRQRPFELTLITNASPDTLSVMERRVAAGSVDAVDTPLDLAWPRSVFSLSHVALPFPPDDPLYGYAANTTSRHVQLGRIEARGENGVLNVPAWMLTRQRSNPFHAYLVARIVRFVSAQNPSIAAGAE
jgi:alpha-beta hydrolase superfamily lysophospholipase